MDNNKRILHRYITLFMCFLLAFYCIASGAAVFAADTQTVRVGYYEKENFQNGASENDPKSGYGYEYLQKIASYTGWRYEYVYGNQSDLMQMLQAGDIDLMAGVPHTDDDPDSVVCADEAMGTESYYIYKDEDNDSLKSGYIVSLYEKRIGVIAGTQAEKLLRKYTEDNSFSCEIVAYNSQEEICIDLRSGEIDAFAGTDMDAGGMSGILPVVKLGDSDYYAAVSGRSGTLIRKLNDAVSAMNEESPNFLRELQARYFKNFAASTGMSSSETAWLDTHDTLMIGFLTDYLPYSGLDKDGNVIGLVSDLSEIYRNELGIGSLNICLTGFATIEEMLGALERGEIDTAFPVYGELWYAENRGLRLSSEVTAQTMDIVFRGEYSSSVYNKMAAAENVPSQKMFISMHYPNSEQIKFDTLEQCINSVKNGTASGTLMDRYKAAYYLSKTSNSELKSVGVSHQSALCFAVRAEDTGLLALINHSLEFADDENISTALYKYAFSGYEVSFRDFLAANIGEFIAVVIVVIGLILLAFILYIRVTVINRRNMEKAQAEIQVTKNQLADALEMAEASSRAKSTFLFNMSHDIRTPMNAIIGFTTLAESHIDNKEKVREYLSKIMISSKHMLSLINDVLDMSRIESGKVRFDEQLNSLPDILHEIKVIIQSDINAKQLDFYIDTVDVVDENIICDRLRLNQILLNLLSNAIKYTKAGGMVSLKVIQTSGAPKGYANFQFKVKDTGIGISKEFQKHIFEQFEREKSTTVSRIQGTGLGMAITKKIVDMMGGTIDVVSEEGVGSEFTVFLPLKLEEGAQKEEKIPELEGLSVLVADDNIDTCLSVSKMLEHIGMRAEWTDSGKEAIVRTQYAIERGDEFSTYIIGRHMPDMNGIEIVRRIRSMIGESKPIILTAYDRSDIEDEAIEAGVTAFCSKPLFLSELRGILMAPYASEKSSNMDTPADNYEKKSILLAEDNELNMEIAQAILTEAGFSVDTAEDGEIAVEKVSKAAPGQYDLILMDVQMPNMNGYEATKAIRKSEDPEKSAIPIIAMTANAFEEDKKNAMEAGMNGHISKPIDVDKLLEAINSILGRAK